MKKLSLNRNKIKVLLLEGIHQNAVKYFESLGYTNIEYHKKALNDDDLIETIRDTHIIGIRSRTHITEKILKHAKKLFTIGCFSIGTNQVDLHAAKLQGIPVFNAPYSNTRSVAELVIAECILLMRGIQSKNAFMHEGKWCKSAKDSYEVRGKTLGIVGYGHIGTQVSILAEAMGMNVIYYDIEPKLNIGNAQACNSLEELLSKSDIVTLHVPETELTKKMIGKKELLAMQNGAFLINAARGSVVDLESLINTLENNHLQGAAIDVFPEEPASNTDPFTNRLKEFENVLLTPHIGGSTIEAQANIGVEVAEKLTKYSDSGSTLGATNFVEIALQPNELKQRFLHIHKNVPGVLREVNYVFTSRGINIASEYLHTDPDIGYIIIDIDNELDKEVLKELKKVPNTIRARMLY